MSNEVKFENILDTYGVLAFTNVGVSMRPLLRQGRDVMVIRKRGPERLKKYDAVLYKRDNGQYILHRILKVRENDYVIVGDNCRQKEYVRENQILGVLEQIKRGGKTVSVTDKGYLFYVHLWCDLFPLRSFLIFCREKIIAVRHMIGEALRKAGLIERNRKKH